MKKLWDYVTKNWKTTLAGVLIGIDGILLKSGVITPEVFGTIVTILGFLGFTAAKDSDKTGTI